ncbi:MAG TPA: glycosyltransferase family 2 protein [Bacteroidales bacterium]|nr:glycosyltransferase family 2 protein [Bacteroidales bacterium]HPS61794.1 glycosyltransferase family 2 protein [Bacteroidales bacterium]
MASTSDPGSGRSLPFLCLALPVMDEPGTLERLLACLSAQTCRDFRLYVCVNQPDSWHDDPARSGVCHRNAGSLSLLRNFRDFPVTVIDHTTRGKGWKGKKLGVGYARKAVMDRISAEATGDEIIVSLDADTVFGERYLESVATAFADAPDAVAMSVPYFHRVPADEAAARAILRYEIYMRHYFLSLARIGSPYTFTALGSAMAVSVRAYRALGGITPKLSGEDFYFLQKLRKYGRILLYNEVMVYPEARFSDRVFFGTGPAMIRGAAGDWSSYPVYQVALFSQVEETYRRLPEFFLKTPDTQVVRFLSKVFSEEDPFEPLRINHKTVARFTRAFHEKFDGLRILQYLKTCNETWGSTDEENLAEYLAIFYPGSLTGLMGKEPGAFRFREAGIDALDRIRMFLFDKEQEFRLTAALSSPGGQPLPG